MEAREILPLWCGGKENCGYIEEKPNMDEDKILIKRWKRQDIYGKGIGDQLKSNLKLEEV